MPKYDEDYLGGISEKKISALLWSGVRLFDTMAHKKRVFANKTYIYAACAL